MQFLDALETAMNGINETFDAQLSLVDKYVEFADSAYQQNIESAELQYLSESNSDNAYGTLEYLYQEAKEEHSSKVSNAIEKVADIFEDFFHDINLKINEIIMDVTLNQKITEIERRVMVNPFLRNQTAEFEVDTEGTVLFETLYPTVFKCFAKLGNRQDCSDEIETLTSKISDWEDNKKLKKVSYKPANIAVFFRENMKAINASTKYLEKEGREIMKKCKAFKYQPNASEALSIGRLVVRISKISANANMNSLKSLLNSLHSLSKTKGKEDKPENETASRKDSTSVKKESTESMFDSFKESLFSEYFLSWGTEGLRGADTETVTFDDLRNQMFEAVSEPTNAENEELEEASEILAFGKKLGVEI